MPLEDGASSTAERRGENGSGCSQGQRGIDQEEVLRKASGFLFVWVKIFQRRDSALTKQHRSQELTRKRPGGKAVLRTSNQVPEAAGGLDGRTCEAL